MGEEFAAFGLLSVPGRKLPPEAERNFKAGVKKGVRHVWHSIAAAVGAKLRKIT